MYQKEIIPDNVVNELKDSLTPKLMTFVEYLKYNDSTDEVVDIKFKQVIRKDYEKLIPIITELAKKIKWYNFILEGCDLNDEGIKLLINQILLKKINIYALDVSGNNITDKSQSSIAELISKTKIQCLCLGKDNYKNPVFSFREVLREAVLNNHTLLHLDGGEFVFGSDISSDEIIEEKLRFNTQMFDEQMRKMNEETKRQKTIKSVHETENKTESKAMEIESQNELKDMELMSNIFKENIKMFDKVVLGISKQNDIVEIKFNPVAKSILNEIITELSKNPVQYSLSFKSCNLNDSDMTDLIQCILQHKVDAIKINFSFNNLSSSCVTQLVALLVRTNIQELDLSRSFLSYDDEYHFNKHACEMIKDAVKNSQSIFKLSLAGHTINDKDAEIINARLEANFIRAELKKAQTKVNTLDKEVNQLKTENDSLHKKIATANDTIKVLDKTHKELFEENANLKYKLKHVPKTKESKVIVTQAHVRGFLARKHYKHELHMKKVQKEVELHKKEIKEEIAKALQNNDYSTVGTLSTLLNQNKIEDAMQIIHGQKNLISFNK